MKSELSILFEDCGDEINIDPELKYCFYVKGCFCPPHKGHMQQIIDYVRLNKNAKIVVNQMGSSKRHGVDKKVNFKIMYLYLKKLLKRDTFELLNNKKTKYIFEHRFVKECDVFINLRGNESNIQECDTDKIIEEKDKKYEYYYKKIKPLLKKGKEVTFLYTSRPHATSLSATNFIKQLIIYQNNMLNDESVNKSRELLYYFCPDEVSTEVKDYVIDKLLSMKNLKYKFKIQS